MGGHHRGQVGQQGQQLHVPDRPRRQRHQDHPAHSRGLHQPRRNLEHDHYGRPAPGQTQTFTYDPEGRTATVTTPSGTTNNTSKYLYDADGNLLEQTSSTGSTDNTRILYLFGGTEQITLNVSAKTCTGLRNITGPDGTTVTRSSTVSYQVASLHGTATTAIDASSLAVTRRYYDPTATPEAPSPPIGWPPTRTTAFWVSPPTPPLAWTSSAPATTTPLWAASSLPTRSSKRATPIRWAATPTLAITPPAAATPAGSCSTAAATADIRLAAATPAAAPTPVADPVAEAAAPTHPAAATAHPRLPHPRRAHRRPRALTRRPRKMWSSTIRSPTSL
ncbi:hypothetical protein E4K10_45675 [Streptomyces sp. T1317-0309]|nr:hypothetical protein E4K10_45675 [Streptomyces sp. T1317-0309]